MPRLIALRCLGPSCLLLLLATSCAVTRPEDVNRAYRDALDLRHNHYTLKPGDTITIAIYSRETDLNQKEIVVLPDGRSDLFYMDNYVLVGKTIQQLEAELKARIAAEVRDPEISIQVKPKDEVCYFVGQFERPGQITMTTKMTLHEAISYAGGMRVTGDTDYALLRRPFKDPRHPELFRIDLNDQTEEIFLLPGDQVVLNRTCLASIVNYVQVYIFGILPGASPLTYLTAGGLVAI
jgi:protein involved in polysaccharide export with SLBB domain